MRSAFPTRLMANRGMDKILRHDSHWVTSYLTMTSRPNRGLRADVRWASSHVDTVITSILGILGQDYWSTYMWIQPVCELKIYSSHHYLMYSLSFFLCEFIKLLFLWVFSVRWLVIVVSFPYLMNVFTIGADEAERKKTSPLHVGYLFRKCIESVFLKCTFNNYHFLPN